MLDKTVTDYHRDVHKDIQDQKDMAGLKPELKVEARIFEK